MKQANGYQKFFKEAQKASRDGTPAKASKPSTARSMFAKSIQQSKLAPEQALKAALTERMKQNRAETKSKKAKFPVGSAIVLTAVLAGVSAGVFFPDQIEKITSKIEIGFFGSAEAANAKPEKKLDSAAKTSVAKVESKEKSAVLEATAKPSEAPDTRNWTPEELSFFNKLNERKQELDLKEAELNKLDEELQQQKAELEVKIQQLDKMRSEISGVLKDRVATDQGKVDKLVQVYAGMKPQQAARVIETINEDLAVEVLDKMKKKSASEILNMMSAKKAQKLSELLAGYRQPATE